MVTPANGGPITALHAQAAILSLARNPEVRSRIVAAVAAELEICGRDIEGVSADVDWATVAEAVMQDMVVFERRFAAGH